MAKITKVAYSRGITINRAKFESLRIDVGLEATLATGDRYDTELDKLRAAVDEELAQMSLEANPEGNPARSALRRTK